jgi:dihydroneopterin aldolase
MDFIFIDDMRVEAHVGIFEREKAAPQTLEISLTFGVPDEAAQDDDIDKTIRYDAVIDRIRAELATRHFNLLETLGEYVIGLLLNEFGAPWVKISIAKMGIMKGVRRVGVQIERSRADKALSRPSVAAVSDLIFGVAMAAVAVNAASAVLETEDKHMDLVGALIVGLAASLGGGSLRDVLLGRPVFWLARRRLPVCGVAAVALTFLSWRGASGCRSGVFLIPDAVGLALFTVVGCRIALATPACIGWPHPCWAW